MGHLAPQVAPLPSLAGGAIIGLAASALMLLIGQVAGISGRSDNFVFFVVLLAGMALHSLGLQTTMTKAEGSVRA
jgi:hypothetical protein